MKIQRLLYAALLATTLMTVAACGGSDPEPPGGPEPLPTDPNDPNNATKDTDCDGLTDKIEFDTDRGGGKKTHPGLTDTDQDGLPDGLELGIDTPVAGTSCTLPKDASTVLKTDPVNPDTDGDGLMDGVEDSNKNGKADDTETHPLLQGHRLRRARSTPGARRARTSTPTAPGTRARRDPRKADTDADGIVDGVEAGVTSNPDPVNCTSFKPDTDPGTKTDPNNADSDGDGISDGAEDTNQNGRVDTGELDPKAGDATGPVAQVCTEANLRPVTFKDASGADIKLALPPTFTEVTPITCRRRGEGPGGLRQHPQGRLPRLPPRRAAQRHGAARRRGGAAPG